MDEAAKDQPQVRRVGRPRKEPAAIVSAPVIAPPANPDAQALAQRIWEGQSPDTLPRKVRLERVRQALEDRGLSMEGVVLK